MTRRLSVTVRPRRFAPPGEELVEVRFPDGRGCLIAIGQLGNEASIQVYGADAGIVVRVDGHGTPITTKGGAE